MNALATLLSAVALAAPATGTNWHPTWSPDGNWIAFTSVRDPAPEIWKTDGVRTRRIVRGGDEPAWSPDGKRIAFTGLKRNIEIVSAAGGRSAPITPAPSGWPSWGPRGRRIAFQGLYGGCGDGFSIYLADPDGRNREALISGDEFQEYFAPVWAPPEGTRLAYVFGQGEALVVVDLVAHSDLVIKGATHPGRASWSPDGKRLVYVSDRTTPEYVYDAPDGFGPMYIVDMATQKLRRLTTMWGNGPAWSPGGKRIAFAAKAKDGSTQIFLVNPDGSHLVQLTKAFQVPAAQAASTPRRFTRGCSQHSQRSRGGAIRSSPSG